MSQRMEKEITRKRSDLEAKLPWIASLLGIAQRQPITRKQANELAGLLHKLTARQSFQEGQITTLEKQVSQLRRITQQLAKRRDRLPPK